jgi:hypothetical protein
MKALRSRRHYALGVFSAVALAGAAYCQEYRGRLQGVVSDASDAIIAGAAVTLTNINTGVAAVRLSDARGRYLFDLVEPGTYTLTAEHSGFRRFVQENILVQNRGDVTVNVQLQLGAVAETVRVTEAPVAVQFNTSTMELTMDNSMVRKLPIVARNPFTLAMLNPAVVNRFLQPRTPFKMWAASSIEVGGTPSQSNDVLVDGMPVMLGPKSSYTPPMDATTEVTVQQNSVDAEYGHSSGGVLNVSMKSGTNDIHGSVSYFGRNPALNALSNPLTATRNLVRNHIWGGSVGHPIVKNRIFNFFAYEQWILKDPKSAQRRMMTEAERKGDFSQSLNVTGGLRTIYDPWTSKLEGSRAVRQPFAGNIIPQSRMDPSSLLFLQEIWGPNRPGLDITGRDNFAAAFAENSEYYNLSNRTDFNISDNLKSFFRFSRFRTTLAEPNWSPNESRMIDRRRGNMNALNVSGDVIWTVSPTTVVNFRGNYISNNDDFDDPELYATLDTFKEYFPNASDFYTEYLNIGAPFYRPGILIDEGGSYGKSNWYFQAPQANYFAGKISRQAGKHYIKAGMEHRNLRVDAIRPETFRFRFRPHDTADSFVAPNTRLSGDAWASFLLGAINYDTGNSWARHVPFKKDTVNYYGAFIQDDFKISRNFTLNLGLRYEYESAIFDRGGSFGSSTFEPDRYSRGLDTNDPIPDFQGSAQPQIPDEALALMDRPYQWAGAWRFTDADRRGMWDPRKLILLPRAGLAIRVNDRTSLRFGFARFSTPSAQQRQTGDVLGSTPVPGFGANTPVAPPLEGVPRQRLSDPFPAAVNPVVSPVGKGDGRYTQMGGDAVWDKREYVTAVNDRFNFTIQRETIARVVVDATYFVNLGRNWPYDLDLNQVNPEIINSQGPALARLVPNPFYLLLPEEKMRGPLRNQRNVALQALLRPYPHYTRVTQVNTDGARQRYHSFQLRLQRPFANGFNFLLAYNYNQDRLEDFFNKEETFLNQFRFIDSPRPRHRMTMAATYEMPFGRGRRRLAQAHPVIDAILGGWTAGGIFWYNSGNRLQFGHMEMVGDPKIDNPDKWGYMFNPGAFRLIPDAAYQVRTNPVTYPGVQGPGYKSLDVNLAKFFQIKERARIEFKMEAYNLTNTFTGGDPNTNVASAAFGMVSTMAAGTQGRELQYSVALHF